MERIIIISTLLHTSDAILCYQCADANAGKSCQTDISGMTSEYDDVINGNSTVNDKLHKYLKNCTAEWGDKCVIENIREAGTGTQMSFIRGCTDGKVFSLTNFVKNVSADNQTACAYSPSNGKVVVCLTVCNSDLCNGPQFPNSVGEFPRINKNLITVTIALSLLSLFGIY